MAKNKYIHSEEVHNLQSPAIIVPLLIDIFKPTSVIDVGCGIGTFLHVFKEYNIKDVLGIDGSWVDENQRRKFLKDSEFQIYDLEKRYDLGKRYDLALSLEVAEHLSESSADTFIENITNLSDIIVFGAAIPGQGGQNHINEQPPEYRIEKFNNYGYVVYDCIRGKIRNDNDVFWWYKQNTFVFVKNPTGSQNEYFSRLQCDNDIKYIIHPQLYKLVKEQSIITWKSIVIVLLKKIGVFSFILTFLNVLRKKQKSIHNNGNI